LIDISEELTAFITRVVSRFHVKLLGGLDKTALARPMGKGVETKVR
jgi:hypothetical protein